MSNFSLSFNLVGNSAKFASLAKILQEIQKGTLLLVGPEGVGKFTFVKNFLSFNKNGELIIFSQPAGNKFYSIDTARMIVSLSRQATLKKFFLINDFHKFTKESQNTLLKTLEDIQNNNIFIFITHSFYSILPTIRSRCLILRFNLVSKKEMDDFLATTIDQTKIKNKTNKQLINFLLKIYPGQPGKIHTAWQQKNKIMLLLKFLKASKIDKIQMIDSLKKNFSLKELSEYFILLAKDRLLSDDLSDQEIESYYKVFDLFLYNDLNFDVQLANLVLNYG
ncbi:MAG: DNA polymerase III subunit delta' [Candidatus Parcubacteria bacterium]|nr:MAG: DNA polymerase III subunit delta' [Candidatus Parcubacteria bacterium]